MRKKWPTPTHSSDTVKKSSCNVSSYMKSVDWAIGSTISIVIEVDAGQYKWKALEAMDTHHPAKRKVVRMIIKDSLTDKWYDVSANMVEFSEVNDYRRGEYAIVTLSGDDIDVTQNHAFVNAVEVERGAKS